MTAIWRNDGEGWRLASPARFDVEVKLHDLVEDAPEVLPLAGAPRLIMLGREVRCGTGSADLVAVERTGRLVLIEVKLAANAEARRAVVAQLLSYAAALRGLTLQQLDTLLRGRLPGDATTVAAAVSASDQEGDFDTAAFEATLSSSLDTGRFRLVFVLDSAPEDLVRLVGYLEDMTDAGLLIDLVTVSEYEAGLSRILVPQRIDPVRSADRRAPEPVATRSSDATPIQGIGAFIASISDAAPGAQSPLKELSEWRPHWSATDLPVFTRQPGRAVARC